MKRLSLTLILLLCIGLPLAWCTETENEDVESQAKKLRSAGERELRAKRYDEVCTPQLIPPLTIKYPTSSNIATFATWALEMLLILQAVASFSKSLHLVPHARTYYQRYKAWMRQHKFVSALSDLDAALELDPSLSVAKVQRAGMLLNLGRCDEAVEALEVLAREDPEKAATGDVGRKLPEARACAQAIVMADKAEAREQWGAVREHLGLAVEGSRANLAAPLFLRRALASLKIGAAHDALMDTAAALRLDSGNVRAHDARAQAMYLLGELDAAVSHVQQGLKRDPEDEGCLSLHRKIRRIQKLTKEGEKAETRGDLGGAAAKFKAAAAVDASHPLLASDLYVRSAKALQRKGDHMGALESAQRAIQIGGEPRPPPHVHGQPPPSGDAESATGWTGGSDALRIIADANLELEHWDEAIRTAHKMSQLPGLQRVADELRQKAEALKKRANSIDYYKVLDIPRNADDRTIKKAYRKLALQWHPDKASSEEEKETFQEQFHKVTTAHEVLTDPEKRRRYDAGEDVDANIEQNRPQHHGPQFFQRGPGGTRFSFHFG